VALLTNTFGKLLLLRSGRRQKYWRRSCCMPFHRLSHPEDTYQNEMHSSGCSVAQYWKVTEWSSPKEFIRVHRLVTEKKEAIMWLQPDVPLLFHTSLFTRNAERDILVSCHVSYERLCGAPNSRPHRITKLLIFHGSPSADVPQSPSTVIFPQQAIRFRGCQRCHVCNAGFSVFISYFLPSRFRVLYRIGSLNRFF
jgi:hypothetical protein